MNERLKQVNHQFADPNEAPAEPKAAATVLLVRDIQGEGLEAVSYTHLTLPTILLV